MHSALQWVVRWSEREEPPSVSLLGRFCSPGKPYFHDFDQAGYFIGFSSQKQCFLRLVSESISMIHLFFLGREEFEVMGEAF